MDIERNQPSFVFAFALLVFVLVTAVPVLADQIIYDDALENGWQQYPWGGVTVNLANTSPTHAGTHSISVDATNYGALYLAPGAAFSTSAYTNLTFWINGGTISGQLLQVQATVNGNEQTAVLLSPPPTNSWQQITVNWSALGVANTSIDGIWIKEQTSAHVHFYVDDIKLTAIPPPTTVHLTANANQFVRTVDSRHFGVNTATWDSQLNTSATTSLLGQIGTKAIRFPGGSQADEYHWQPNTGGGVSTDGLAHVVTNLGAAAIITVNYGSGTAQEAAAWVAHANVTNHYAFKYWEIGNENYGFWETDTNAAPNDPYTYGTQAQSFISQMKAADPTIKIGVPVVTGEDSFATYSNHPATNSRTHVVHNGWTPVLLTTMKNLGVTPDFLIYHNYPQDPGGENDASLLQSSLTWTNYAADLRQQLSDYLGTNGTNVELLCTENNSVSTTPGKQSTSLVNGLYMADSFGEMLQTEFNSWLWWDLRNDQETTNNNSSSLYGWRQYGDYGIIYNTSNCYPTYYVGKLLHDFAGAGDKIIHTTSDYSMLSCYAARRTNGSLTLLVVNKSQSSALTGSITLTGFAPATNATNFSYGIPQDNAAQSGIGSQDVALTNFIVSGTNFSNSFPAYSVTVLSLPPAAPKLTMPSYPSAGHFQFQLNGASNASYIIQGSTNLKTWLPLATNTLTTGSNSWVDLQSSNSGRRFYRAVWVP